MRQFYKTKKAQSIIEYLLVIAAIIGVVLVARNHIGNKVNETYKGLANKMANSISTKYGF